MTQKSFPHPSFDDREYQESVQAKKAPLFKAGLFDFATSTLANSILERLSGLEGGESHRRDFDLLAWVARIHTHA